MSWTNCACLVARVRTLLLSFALLSGCSVFETAPPPAQSPMLTAVNQALAQRLSHWTIRGKIGLTHGVEKYSAAINQWEQNDRSFDIQLSSTLLGMGATRLSGTPEQLSILSAGEPERVSDNPEALLEAALGWPLPIREVSYWLRGIPAPGPAYEWESKSNETVLMQSGWAIQYQRVTARPTSDGTSPLWLPEKMTLTRDKTRIRLIISEWNL